MTEEQEQSLTQAVNYFQHFDINRDGSLSLAEFRSFHGDLLAHGYAVNPDVEQSLRDLDTDNDGEIR